jgi:hypothetical protein
MNGFVCKIDETQQGGPDDDSLDLPSLQAQGVRTLALGSYDVGKYFYGVYQVATRSWPSPVHWVNELGCICFYAVKHPSHKRKTKMKIAEMVTKWHAAVVGLAIAHDKDTADRIEASVEELLVPITTAPCDQIRQFAALLAAELMNDKNVPYLVWSAFQVWQHQMEKAPDEEVKELKHGLAREIVDMVESDAKDQLPEAMVRALMWRSPAKLEEVKAVVTEEKAAGRKVRLRGRESCLFLEAGGTEENPAVCVQV